MEWEIKRCRETKPNIITSTNHNTCESATNQSELDINTGHRRQARENTCVQVTIGFRFHWLRKGHDFLVTNYRALLNEISFDPQLKTNLSIFSKSEHNTERYIILTYQQRNVDGHKGVISVIAACTRCLWIKDVCSVWHEGYDAFITGPVQHLI